MQQPSPPSARIPCAKLQVKNGHVSLNKVRKGGTVHAKIFCKEGFILQGKDTLTCTKSGKWDGDVPKCISEWNQHSSMEELLYLLKSPHGCYSIDHCPKFLEPNNLSSFEILLFFLSGIDCGPPPLIQNAIVQCSDTTFNGRAEYKCNEGFLLVGSSKMVCQSDGKTANWTSLGGTDSAPFCKCMLFFGWSF